MQTNEQKEQEKIEKIADSRKEKDRGSIHQKIQLWTNEQENEYALRLAISATNDNNQEDSFVARTSLNSTYTHLIAESDYLEDLKHGWDYTLRHFVEEYKQEVLQRMQTRLKEEDLQRMNPVMTEIDTSSNARSSENETEAEIADITGDNEIQQKKHYSIKLIPHIKCHYCDLHFHNSKDRNEDELEWHV
jgi:hypothetical protein